MRNSAPLLLASFLLLAGCDKGTYSSDFAAEIEQRTRDSWAVYDRQDMRFDEQLAKTDKQLAQTDKQQAKTDKQQAKADEQTRRLDDLLRKWEEQARRYDAILDAMEKQQGIKK